MSFPSCYRWLSVASLAPICDHTFPEYCKQHAGPSERSPNSGPSCGRNSKGCSFWGTVIGSGHRQRRFPAFVFFWLFVMSTRVLQFFFSQSGAETSHISSVIVETCKVFYNTYVINCFQMFQSVSFPQSKDVVKGFSTNVFFCFREVLAHAVVFGCCADRLGIMSHPLYPFAASLAIRSCEAQTYH